MTNIGISTVAQLLLANQKSFDFARIVSELDSVLTRVHGNGVQIAWDCDDLVSFEMPGARIHLAWSEHAAIPTYCWVTISVGPGLSYDMRPIAEHEVFCSRLIERISRRFDAVATLWRQMDGPLGTEHIDLLIEALPQQGGLPAVESILDSIWRTDLDLAALLPVPVAGFRAINAPVSLKPQGAALPRVSAAPSVQLEQAASVVAEAIAKPAPLVLLNPLVDHAVANDRPDLPRERNEELILVRQALYADVDEVVPLGASPQMRLAAHCLNATLVLVWAPMGAAVITYSVLRGANMQMSARLMAVTGTVFAVSNSPVGQTMAAMAKGFM